MLIQSIITPHASACNSTYTIDSLIENHNFEEAISSNLRRQNHSKDYATALVAVNSLNVYISHPSPCQEI